MIRANRQQPLVPSFRVTLDGRPIDPEMAACVAELVVEDDLDLPGMFTVELHSREDQRGTQAWTDAEALAPGARLGIALGYGDRFDDLMAGEITALEPEFRSDGPPRLTVRGYDRRHRLNAARRTRSFVDQKDSDIAARLAADAGIPLQAADSAVLHPYMLQAAQTDLDFLLQRAQRIGWELLMDGDTLLFRPTGSAAAEALTLGFDDDLLDFAPRLSLPPASQLQVTGWDPKARQPIKALARAGDEVGAERGLKTGAQQSAELLGDAVEMQAGLPVASQAEADQMAAGLFNRMSLEHVRGEGSCLGCTGVRAGRVIRLAGLGRRFSGRYYVTSAVHRYARDDGYVTRFAVRRNAS